MKHAIVASVVVMAFMLLLGAPSTGPGQRQMAVTVDDLPISQVSWHDPMQMDRITSDLLAVLTRHGVPAVGFVNANKLENDGAVDPRRVELLKRWLDAGFELGNHSYSHPDLHRMPLESWLADVLRGEEVIRPLIEGRGGKLRYFRHPFLHTGRSVEIQAAAETWLVEHGYAVAPVTVDNSEWIYGSVYSKAYNRDDEALKARLGSSYLNYMMDVVRYSEGQAEAIVGRPIPHVLLIHAYALNADHLDTLLSRLEAEGWAFVTLEQALADPVYRRPSHGYTGSGGITWLHRWAITQGMDRSIFAGEPEVPGWVEELR